MKKKSSKIQVINEIMRRLNFYEFDDVVLCFSDSVILAKRKTLTSTVITDLSSFGLTNWSFINNTLCIHL